MTTPSLSQHFPVDQAHLQRLHARLERDAEAGDLLDIAYRTVDSAVGPLLLASTPRGLLRVAFANESRDSVLQNLSTRISPRVLEAPARLDPVARQLEEFFAGRRRSFDVALDWSLSQGFRRTVLERLNTGIGYGTTTSYATLARLSGSPKAVRAVGTACGANHVAVVIPCHRAQRSDGSMGGYAYGVERKAVLLNREGVK
jgi:methylated-DNA-[protein]-cysteine S-methyltransferase